METLMTFNYLTKTARILAQIKNLFQNHYPNDIDKPTQHVRYLIHVITSPILNECFVCSIN